TQSVTFTATVSAGTGFSGTPTGTVTFTIDNVPQGSPVPLNGANQATLTISTLTGGSHTISATYNGDPAFAASTSAPLNQVVTPAATTTTIISSLNPSIVGNPVTFTATVTSAVGTPVGNVTFVIDGTNQTPPVNLDANGKATLTTSSLTASNHSVSVNY